MSAIRRYFVRVGERDVHLRCAGAGPAVLAIHQSPQSSAALESLIRELASEHFVIAPDTPGFGWSDPYPRLQPTIADFAEHLAGLLDVLGIERVAVYGVHTGASIALRFGLMFPERTELLLLDGLARFTEAEKRTILARYLPACEPSWDGGHLLWLWARLREQSFYFPWFDDRAACRLQFDHPSPEKLQRDLLDALNGGDAARVGYRAPFLVDDPEGPAQLAVATHILYRADDVLASHAARLPVLPRQVVVESVPSGSGTLLARVRTLLAAHRDRLSAAAMVDPQVPARRLARMIALTSLGEVAWRVRLETAPSEPAELVLHEPGKPPGDVPELRRPRAGGSLLVPELPGHAASSGWDAAVDLDTLTRALIEGLDGLGVDRCQIHAHGHAAALGLALARRLAERAVAVVLHAPPVLESDERATLLANLPDLAVDPDGAHLLRAWNWVRRKALFPEWLPPRGQYARRVAAPAPLQIHSEAAELIRLGPRFNAQLASCVRADLDALARGLCAPLTIRSPLDHAHAARHADYAARIGARLDHAPSIGDRR